MAGRPLRRARRANPPPDPLYGNFWVDKHLLVQTRSDEHGGWYATVTNNGVVIDAMGGGAGHPTRLADIERLARQAQRSLV